MDYLKLAGAGAITVSAVGLNLSTIDVHYFYFYQLLIYFNILKIMTRELRCEKYQKITIRK
jgi:hypothetical protein